MWILLYLSFKGIVPYALFVTLRQVALKEGIRPIFNDNDDGHDRNPDVDGHGVEPVTG